MTEERGVLKKAPNLTAKPPYIIEHPGLVLIAYATAVASEVGYTLLVRHEDIEAAWWGILSGWLMVFGAWHLLFLVWQCLKKKQV